MDAEEIRKLLKEEKLVIGTEKTIKSLKEDKVLRVFISKNCPSYVKQEIVSNLSKAELVELEQNNQQLGTICKKPYSISVMSLLR